MLGCGVRGSLSCLMRNPPSFGVVLCFFFFSFFVGGVVGVAFRSSNFENYQLLLQSTCNFLQPKQFGI
jgi:hypothetical protein